MELQLSSLLFPPLYPYPAIQLNIRWKEKDKQHKG